MKKYLIISLLSLATALGAKAQEYKLAKSTGKLMINIPSVTVEGYSGNEIVFSSQKKESEIDPRAKGLQAINGSGYTDNTGLGVSVTETGGNVEVNSVVNDLAIKIMVPKGMLVSYQYHKVSNSGMVHFKNMQNEIEISTDYNKIELENVTGPLTVRALYGSVDATFGEPVKGPVSITSVYAAVDVSIPVSTKANLKLITSHGSILAAAELKIELEKTVASDDMISYGGNIVTGKINGGGIDFKLNSEYGKIYLRKNK